jgi:hypothetical protein
MNQAANAARRLNHVEFVHRPGEGDLVLDLFAALGCPCTVSDTPEYGRYVVVQLDGSPHGENDMFVSEAEPEQLALEDALREQIAAAGSPLAQAAAAFQRLQHERPFRATHVGVRIPSIGVLDEVIARLEGLRAGRFAGRLSMGGEMIRTAEESRATSTPMKQIWVWTDVISTGLLAVGQQIELQAYQ